MTQRYYFSALEKVTAAVLAFFNDIRVSQYTYSVSTATWTKTEKLVPIEMATREKVLREFEQSRASETKRYFNVPRMALNLDSIQRYPEKQTNQMNSIKSPGTELSESGRRVMQYVRNPSWWKANYTLSVVSKRMSDMAQIVEQICPQFQPQRAIAIKLIPELGISVALETVISDSMPFQAADQLDAQSVRLVECSFQVNAAVPMFPPITDSAIIETITARFGAVNTFDVRDISLLEDEEEFKIYGDKGPKKALRLSASVASA